MSQKLMSESLSRDRIRLVYNPALPLRATKNIYTAFFVPKLQNGNMSKESREVWWSDRGVPVLASFWVVEGPQCVSPGKAVKGCHGVSWGRNTGRPV